MDRIRVQTPSAWWQHRVVRLSAALTGVLALAVFGFSLESVNKRADADNLLFGIVKQGDMDIKVRGNGILVPDDIQWIASQVEGRVDKVYLKAGAAVIQGDLLVRLSNPEINQAADESSWALEALEAEYNALEVGLDSELLNQQAIVLKSQFAFDSAQLQLEAETKLIRQHDSVISAIDYKRTQLNVHQLKQSWEIEIKRLEKFKANIEAQLLSKQAQVKKLARTSERAAQQVANLDVRASMSGIVQVSPMEPGQHVNVGTNIAKIADPGSLFAEVQIPELVARDVALNQRAVIDTRNGLIDGVVIRVDPAVVNGNVQVDVRLLGDLPKGSRPDLSIEGTVYVAELKNTLYVNRPAFVQSGRLTSLFRLDDTGFARKRRVQLGKASVNQVQILEGLQVGDQIVLSDTNDWTSYQSVKID